MICLNCGSEIISASKFCSNCGAQQISEQNRTSHHIQESKNDVKPITNSQTRETKIANKIKTNLTLLALCFGIGIATYFLLRYGYFESQIHEGGWSDLDVGSSPFMSETHQRTNKANELSWNYSIITFLIAVVVLLIGRYLLKGLNWVQKTSDSD